MFDIGFFELLIIGVVGLMVIGPERLPSTIKTVALWFGRIKRSITDARTEIEQQLGADEIRRELHNEQILHNLEKMKDTRAELESRIQEWQKMDEAAEKEMSDHEPSAAHEDAKAEEALPPAQQNETPSNPESDTKEPQPASPPSNDKPH